MRSAMSGMGGNFGGGGPFRTNAEIAADDARAAENSYLAQKRQLELQALGGRVGAGGGGGGIGGASAQLINTNFSREQYDPWSKYRAASGDKLAVQNDNDPSNFYRDKLQNMSQAGGGDFQTSDPSYLFRLQQGQQALERSGAAKGLLGSGNMGVALQNYGQNAASQEYQAQFSRMTQGLESVSKQYDTQMQRLMKMAGIDNDPAMADKLKLQAEQTNTDRIKDANNFNASLLGGGSSGGDVDRWYNAPRFTWD